MGDLPGDLGLIVIDDLPEMIGCVKERQRGYFVGLLKMKHLGNAFLSSET